MLGFHMRTSEVNSRHNGTATQMFAYGPGTFKRNKINKGVKNIYIHSDYHSTWKYYFRIQEELGVASNLDSWLIVHVGKHSIKTIRETLTKIDNKIDFKCKIMLEGKPVTEFSFHDRIQKFAKEIGTFKNIKLGICLDTQHMYAEGKDVDSVKFMKKYLNMVKDTGYPMLIHLNDSYYFKGYCRDKHAPIGTNIWKESLDSLKYIIEFCKKNNVDYILERHDYDYSKDLEILNNL